MNIYEHGLFESDKRQQTMTKIINGYNGIIDRYESDPSLKINID